LTVAFVRWLLATILRHVGIFNLTLKLMPLSASREAEIGLAFIAFLRADGKDQSNSEALDDRAEIMVLALALLTQLESQVSRLDEVNIKLASDLEKREAVLKRLRELTLGQLED
jgi:hypothetical protein